LKTYDAVIVGAGPAGLTTAYTLAKAGRSVLVVEQDPAYVGGISRTVNYKGFLFDIGGHRFFSKSKEVVDLWNEILPHDFIERPRLSRIFYRGQFYSYPLKAFEALRKLGVAQSALCLASFAYARAFPIRNPRTVHQWVRNQFGERLFRIFFKTYTEKVWGMRCDEISAEWAAQRIKGLDLGAAILDALNRSLGRKKRGAVAKTLIESFRYPRRGPGMMWEACATKIRKLGAEIRMDRKLVSLAYDEHGGTWSVAVESGAGACETFTAQHVVSSAPVRELVAALRPTALSRLHARELKYRDFLTVVLIGKSGVDLPDNWIYIHDPKVKVGRVQNFRSWSPDMIPDETSTCLGSNISASKATACGTRTMRTSSRSPKKRSAASAC
jgi:protoporphyrinogen oxidase